MSESHEKTAWARLANEIKAGTHPLPPGVLEIEVRADGVYALVELQDHEWKGFIQQDPPRKWIPAIFGKGSYQGECNRSSCHNPNAVYLNKSTQKFYCKSCADKLNQANPDAQTLYGAPLCELKDGDK